MDLTHTDLSPRLTDSLNMRDPYLYTPLRQISLLQSDVTPPAVLHRKLVISPVRSSVPQPPRQSFTIHSGSQGPTFFRYLCKLLHSFSRTDTGFLWNADICNPLVSAPCLLTDLRVTTHGRSHTDPRENVNVNGCHHISEVTYFSILTIHQPIICYCYWSYSLQNPLIDRSSLPPIFYVWVNWNASFIFAL